MAICSYFLQGNCRFGNKCWNDHNRGSNQGGGTSGFSTTTSNQFAALSSQGNSGPWRSNTSAPADAGKPNLQALVAAISEEMRVWSNSGMWPFSSFTYEKEGKSLEGFEDLSPEEVRNEAYEAQKSGKFDEYKQKMATLGAAAINKRNLLQQPSIEMKQKLIHQIESLQNQASSSSSTFGGSSSGGVGAGAGMFGKSGFSGASQAAGSVLGTQAGGGGGAFGSGTAASSGPFQASRFGASGGSAFGGQSGPPTGLFGNTSQPAGQSTAGFAQPPTGLFGKPTASVSAAASSTFGTSTGPSLFAATSTTQSAFGGTAGTTGQSAFGGSAATAGQSLFGKSTPAVGQSIFGASSAVGQSAFGGAGSTGGQSAFGGSSTAQLPSGFSFAQQGSSSQSTFGATGQSQASVFGGTSAPQGSMLGATSSTQGSAFGGQSSTPAASSSIPPAPSGSSLYTPLDQLTAEEKQHFEAPKFILGKIPTRPPPKELV